MAKVTLTDLVNLTNATTAVNTINSNNLAVETAMENTLSRDGTAPNTMGANLDMNSYRILNLPLGTSNYEPLRVLDAATLNGGGTISVSAMPSGGTAGQVLTKNSSTAYDAGWSTLSGANYTAPYTGGTLRTVTDKLSDLVSVLDFGVSPFGVDSTTAFNTALTNARAIVVPPGNYTISGNVTIPSNTFLWIQKNATLTITSGRFTAYGAGIHDVHIRLDGTMNFLATATATTLTDWAPNVGVATRGLIEFGGTLASVGSNFTLDGSGTLTGDYNYVGIPTSFYDINYQLNRKGVCIVNANNCKVDGINVSTIHGEAIYWQGVAGAANVQFTRNKVTNVAFNALNFNIAGLGNGFLIKDNYVQGAWQGIELSTGVAENNYILQTTTGILSGAGGGGGPLVVSNNKVYTARLGISIDFSSAVEIVTVVGNTVINCSGEAIGLNHVQAFLVANNLVYSWANSIAGAAINIYSVCTYGYVNGNVLRLAGASSSGGVVNNGTSVTAGTNPVF